MSTPGPPRRGRGGGRQPGGGGSSSNRNEGRGRRNNQSRRPNNRPRGGRGQSNNQEEATNGHSNGGPGLRDEDILIAFMPYLKSSNAEATAIHERYQSGNDQRAFLSAARAFLDPQQQQATVAPQSLNQPAQTPRVSAPASVPAQSPALPSDQSSVFSSDSPTATPMSSHPFPPSHPNPTGDPLNGLLRPDPPGTMRMPETNTLPRRPQSGNMPRPLEPHPPLPQNPSLQFVNNDLDMTSVERALDSLWKDDSKQDSGAAGIPVGLSAIWGPPAAAVSPPRSNPSNSPWNSPSIGSNGNPASAALPTTSAPAVQQSRILAPQPSSQPQPKVSSPLPPLSNGTDAAKSTTAPTPSEAAAPATAQRKKEAPPPKRLWLQPSEQPGRILVKSVGPDDPTLILPLGPREELVAHWILPLRYLREKRPRAKSVEEALVGLTVGLFRRGCTENGGQASIISKRVLGDDNRSYEYWKDNPSETMRGKVPFYSPRTPGHVLFRMYWDDEQLYTLAMGPTLKVRVLENDFENSMRFILSNFKGKKHNPTSLSSLHSLALVLETQVSRPNDSSARATWGCVQEARKVIEACWVEYTKTLSKLGNLEEVVEELKKEVKDEGVKAQALSGDSDSTDEIEKYAEESSSAAALALREKTRTLMSGRASCERKWRDSQQAFASILKAAVTNQSMQVLLRRDLINRMRIEYELWCPLSEEFAIPSETARMWFEPLRDLSHAITADDFQGYSQARVKMQMRTLGFDPNTAPMDDILFPRNRNSPNQRGMDPGAVGIFNGLSAAMGQYYQDLYADEDTVVRQRELIRERTEKCVQECGAFPPGTRVLIFGSSANGFGSPKSDIDMCLQLPRGLSLDTEDETGSQAMARLAEYFEKDGMKAVDTARLTARIPIVMYKCLNPLAKGDAEEDLIDCDLSMHNPLAVINTALLRSYAEMTPVTRVLAAIIKKWAKARDINNPARHTLSSYGYIIMLLHFLTFHKRTGNGLVSTVAPPEGDPAVRNRQAPQATPILPNLQWMDPRWPTYPKGTPYQELPTLPKSMLDHPFSDNKRVNTYFHQPDTPNEKAVLQMLFPGQDLSLAILLASFFRYYAYEFDYKKHVVSLHSTACRGVMEREVKAELDSWRNYSAALTIEDPFETFYDVAHVLRGGYYHRIRREFAVAYSKIADAAAGRNGTSWNKGDLQALSGDDLIEWLCEPVTSE